MTCVPDGLVLAGGSGRRLGRPKAGVVLEGTTLVECAVAMLAERCDDVVVVSRPDIPLPALGVPVVLDDPGPSGAMTGLVTGLGTLTAADVLVLACDLPLAAPLLDRLIEVPGHATAVASDGTRLQPLCARYPRSRALEAGRRLMAGGVLRMTELAAALDAVTVPATGHELLNVNHSGDLAQAARLWASPRRKQTFPEPELSRPRTEIRAT